MNLCLDVLPWCIQLIQVSQGMAALHAEGIVHGNLRLSNIYLNPATKRTVISSTAWDQLLPYDVLSKSS